VKTNPKGYTASKWSKAGCVAAPAVNAIHLKVDTNVTGDYGVIFSILPKNFLKMPKDYQSYLSPDASIYTNIWGGHGIFGGGYAPFVGSPIYLEKNEDILEPLPLGYKPATGDVLVIKVLRPDPMPKEIVFENRFGGRIFLRYAGREPRVVGQVLRPVIGAGRFLGTQYAETGRVRANHSGVIDISTAQEKRFGGFQIIPAGHGMSPEMITARTMSQWMVVGPLGADDPSWENTGPLFAYFLRPSYRADDLEDPDWKKKLARRYLVQIKYRQTEEDALWNFFDRTHYQLNTPLPAKAMKDFDNIELIRIYMPNYAVYAEVASPVATRNMAPTDNVSVTGNETVY
jgi:hypothetical protein